MKLLFISTEKGWHGGEEQLRLLVSGAAAAGHECRVATREGSIVADRLGSNGATVLKLPRAIRGPRSIWRLRRAVQKFRPDVIHANDPHGLSLQRTATWGLSVPARICSRRVLFPIYGTRKYRAGCDRMVCVSHAIAAVCRKSRIPDEMLAVVHDGADPARVRAGDGRRGRASLGLPADVPLVLCVAQLAQYKGHRYLLDAIPAVLAKDPRAILALAGDGPLREELSTQCRALGIDGVVRFLGYRDDVPDLIRACDVFALASPEEGLGTSVLDATFAGRPVVAADAGGIPEMLRDGAGRPCGWLVAPRDPAALAQGINEALATPDERARRVALAQEWAAAEFTAATMVGRMLEVYADVLG
ncbi:MAG TPA: glycosyltransferase family 4 protein [Lacipirellulaceae bacterium]